MQSPSRSIYFGILQWCASSQFSSHGTGSSMINLVLYCLDHNASVIKLFLRCLANKRPVYVNRQLSLPICRTLMVTPYFQDIRPFFKKWKPAVFILFHPAFPQNLRLILIVVNWLVMVGYCKLIVKETESCNGPYSIALTIKRCVVEVPIVFRLHACCVLQPFIFAFFNISFTSPCTCSFSPILTLPSLSVNVLPSISPNSSMLSAWYRIKKIGDTNGY